MAKVQTIQTNFSAGELSPRLDGRVDIKKYANGLRTCQNFTILPHGGARKRSGTQFVVEQKSATDSVVLVPFQFNVEQAYCLVFGPNYVWFAKDRGIITYAPITITGITQANPGVVTAAGHGLTNGDRVILSGVSGMVEVNNRQFIVANVTANTFELSGVNSTAFTAYTANGTVNEIVELTTTYTQDELAELAFAQSNDTLYIAHKNHPLRKLTRTGHTSWQLSEPNITTGPFRSINADRTIKITPSAFSGSATGYGTQIVGRTCTLTATGGNVFDTAMVGTLFRFTEEGGISGISSAPVGDSTRSITTNDVYTFNGKVYGVYQVSGASNWGSFNRVPEHDSGTVRVSTGSAYFDSDFLHPSYCVVRITAVASATSATAEIVRYQMPKSIIDNGTSFFEEGAWSAYRGYPRAISFYEQRLFLAGTDTDPSVLWGSRSGLYEDFEDGSDDDDAISYRISAGSADVVRWLMTGRVLTAGSSFGEFAIAASNQNEALTPSNFKASPQTNYGTSTCPPVRINQTVLYPQRQGEPENAARKLREYSYDYAGDQFNSVDLTVFAEHIFGAGLTRIAYQTEPDSIVWVRRTDGQMAGCTYERAQEVVAWHRHVLGGEDAQVESLTVIPGNEADEVWLSVKRILGNAVEIQTEDDDDFITEDGFTLIGEDTPTVRYIEVMQPAFADDGDKEDAKLLDSMLTYTGNSTTTISGLYHLRNLAVSILNNGALETGTVSATGSLTLSRATTKAHIGFPYTAILETEDFEAGAQAGTAQSRAKRVSEVYLRVLNSLGGTFGPDATTQKTIYNRTGAMPMGSSPPLQSGFLRLEWPGGWERWARVRIEHSDPLPMHITGIVAEMSVTG